MFFLSITGIASVYKFCTQNFQIVIRLLFTIYYAHLNKTNSFQHLQVDPQEEARNTINIIERTYFWVKFDSNCMCTSSELINPPLYERMGPSAKKGNYCAAASFCRRSDTRGGPTQELRKRVLLCSWITIRIFPI